MVSHPATRDTLLAALRAHRVELRADGVEAITVFGSVARDEADGASDVDLAIRAGVGFSLGA